MKLSMHLHQFRSAMYLGAGCLWQVARDTFQKFKKASSDQFTSYRARMRATGPHLGSMSLAKGLAQPKPMRPKLFGFGYHSDATQTIPDLTRSNTPPSAEPKTPGDNFFFSHNVTLLDSLDNAYTVECLHEGVPYLAKIIKNKDRFEVDYADASIQETNRQRFVEHTKNLVKKQGMQAARPQLLAAAKIFDVKIRVWSPHAHEHGKYCLQDIIEPESSSTEKIVDLLLSMRQGDSSHFQPFQGNLILDPQGLNPIGTGQRPIESGSEGECFYFSMMWSLDHGDSRALRAEYEKQKSSSSYVEYFIEKSNLLEKIHMQISQELAHSRYQQAIDGEVQDSLGIQLKKSLKLLNQVQAF